ncbi:MAG: Gfo/Idh/MocA family oxidoreductase [Abitibacteriaceae bacterium]|nr:Gfo/Idh/MocA family oxidoreductase [Abditibacteriaceae bacterium]MBV9866304.1 Gfo/Idh/MocA family oxidoreductase [Abditibacteriaceae bacterium]
MAKVRVAILGCGGMAGAHAQRYKKNPDVEIVALSDVSEDVVNRFIERNLKDYEPKPAIFTDPAQMYAEAKPDAVSIVTPHTMHYEHGIQALEAGCHVLMEKPMVTASDQAHKLAEKVKETGKIFTIGYNTPCTPEFRYLRNIVRNKEMGKLETVTGWLAQNWRQGTKGSWRQDPSLSGGGQMYDSGAHLFNSLVWTVEQPIKDVLAFVDNMDTPVDINGTVNIRFADGTLATITVVGNCPSDGAGMYLTFEEGRVEIDGWGGSWIKVFRRGEGQIKYPPIPGKAETPNDNFINAILGRDEPMTSPLNGINQSELMDAIYESAQTGQIAHPKAR